MRTGTVIAPAINAAIVGCALGLAAICGASSVAAVPAARVFVNVKVAAEAERSDAALLADGYCTSHGFAKAASYENPPVVRSQGYVRFALLRCLKVAEEETIE